MSDIDILTPASEQIRKSIGFQVCSDNPNVPSTLPDDEEGGKDLDFWGGLKEFGINAYAFADDVGKNFDGYGEIRKIYPHIDAQSARDITLIQQAVDNVFDKGDLLAIECMRHFFERDEKRKGHTIKISMSRLLIQDSKARLRIMSAITSRMAADRSFQDSWKYVAIGVAAPFPIDPKLNLSKSDFPLRQSEYSTQDWKNALGSFRIFWSPSFPSRKLRSNVAPRQFVWIWGEKKYWRWHSKTKRADHAVHEAGSRLAKAGIGKYYRIVGEPCLLDLKTGFPLMISEPSLGDPPANEVTRTV